MLKPKKNIFIRKFLEVYVGRLLKSDFEKINLISNSIVPNEPILLVGNHVSWWDGFIAYYISRYFFKRRYYLMILEKELSKIQIFRYAGAFSINPGSRDVVNSINYCNEVLSKKENLLTFFPQGIINSIYNSEFKWIKGGIEKMLKKSNAKLYFYAVFFDYMDKKKPTLNIYIEECRDNLNPEADYNNFYSNCFNIQKAKKC